MAKNVYAELARKYFDEGEAPAKLVLELLHTLICDSCTTELAKYADNKFNDWMEQCEKTRQQRKWVDDNLTGLFN